MKNRSFVYLAVLLVVGAAVILGLRRPWQSGPGVVGAQESDPPVGSAALRIVKQSGGPCGVTILGNAGDTSNSSSASLAKGNAQSASILFPAPYTIEAVTVTRGRDGSPQRQQLKLTLAGGQRY